MANKDINELTEKDKIKGNDLSPIYDSSEAGSEKTKKIDVQDFVAPKWHPATANQPKPQIVCMVQVAVNLVLYDGTDPKAYMSAADFIKSVVHNESAVGGGPPYLYGINLAGDAPDVTHSDPRDAFVEVNCDHLPTAVLEVWVKDTGGSSSYVECIALVQDPDTLCV